jgi:replicative DNA helicase
MFDSAAKASPLLGLSQRSPPANILAEQSLLGAILANNKAFDRVSSFLCPEHFADPIHGRIYKAISDRINSGRLADAVTLKGDFENSGILGDVGGTAYLAQLLTAMVGIINAAEYGESILDTWRRRQAIDIGEMLVNGAFDGSEPAQELCLNTAVSLDRLSSVNQNQPSASMDESIVSALERSEAAFLNGGFIGHQTGFTKLDSMMGGLEAQCVYYAAGRPGMGKTSLATQLMEGVAKIEGKPVLFRSLEMSKEQVIMRMLSQKTGIPLNVFRTGQWKSPEVSNQWARQIGEAGKYLRELQIRICDQGAQTVEAIASEARTWKRLHGDLGLIVIDYLQLLKPRTDRFGRTESTTQLSNDLKKLAKDLNCPVLALSQLNRGPENREDKRPQLADLRDSGSIEQDAEAVIFLYREAYYLERERPKHDVAGSESEHLAKVDEWQQKLDGIRGQAEWILAKQRNGPTGIIEMLWDESTTTFKDKEMFA